MPSLSMLYQLVRCLRGLIRCGGAARPSKDAELLALRHQNAVLHRQISACVTRLPTGCGWPPYRGCCHVAAGPRSSRLLRPRCWPGTAGSSHESGTTPHAANQDGHPSQRQSGTSWYAWQPRTPPGDISACRANWSASAIASPPPRYGRSCTTLILIPPRVDQVRPDASS